MPGPTRTRAGRKRISRAAYYDVTARHGKGAWRGKQVFKSTFGKIVDMPWFHTERDARKHIGLKGGSDDPNYRGEQHESA